MLRAGRNLSNESSCRDVSDAMLIGDAMLEPLAANGGPTRTHALAADRIAFLRTWTTAIMPSSGACRNGAVTVTVEPPGTLPAGFIAPAPLSQPINLFWSEG